MKAAVLPIAAAAMLSACTTTDTQRAAATSRTDYSHLSCREIAAELAITERAVMSGARHQPLTRDGETAAQAYLFPASLGAAAPAASAKLEARLEDLRRASRAKRCESAWRSYETAKA